MKHSGTIAERRELTQDERQLHEWLFDHGEPVAAQYRPQLDEVVVLSRCACGCPSLMLGSDFDTEEASGTTTIVADAHGESPEGVPVGVILQRK